MSIITNYYKVNDIQKKLLVYIESTLFLLKILNLLDKFYKLL